MRCQTLSFFNGITVNRPNGSHHFPISGVLTSGHGQLRQGHANYLAAVESLKTPAVPINMSGTLAPIDCRQHMNTYFASKCT